MVFYKVSSSAPPGPGPAHCPSPPMFTAPPNTLTPVCPQISVDRGLEVGRGLRPVTGADRHPR